jgi:hypothetical protein
MVGGCAWEVFLLLLLLFLDIIQTASTTAFCWGPALKEDNRQQDQEQE